MRVRRPALRVVALVPAAFAWLVVAGGPSWVPGASAVAAAQGAHPGHAGDPLAGLPTDPSVVLGQLENGLSYAVKRHATPPGKAAVWIHIKTGSLNERDEQRGLAHFLEHMAFNGSANFAPFEVVDFFQSLGMTFGQDQNAFTGFDQTAYQLYLPDAEPATLAKGLTFFADVADRLLLDPEQIEEERGVILEENRTGKGPGQRVRDQWLSRLAPGSLIGERLPIGTEETISSVDREDFVAYYRGHYTPSRMTVIVVGDMEPSAAVAEIARAFSAVPAREATGANDPGVKPYTEQRAIVAHDPELTSAEVSVMLIDEPRPAVRTEGDLRTELADELAATAFNRRIENKVSAGEVSFDSGGAFAADLFGAMRLAQASASGKPEAWPRMLEDITLEVQRARLHGFGERELSEAQAQYLSQLEQVADREATLPQRVVISQIATAINDDEPILSAAQRLELARRWIPTIDRNEVNARFSRMFDLERATFLVTLPDSAGVPEESEVLGLGAAAAAQRPEPDLEPEVAEALLDARPAPGAVVDLTEHQASGVWSAWLENGVRVHHRYMDERENYAEVSITLAGGEMLETAESRGVTQAAGLAWGRAATATLTSEQIRGYMAGVKVSVGGGGGEDAMVLSVTGSPDDLETGMELAHRLLTDPYIEPAGFEQWRTQTVQGIEASRTDPLAMMGVTLQEAVFPADEARALPLTVDQVNALRLADAQRWLERQVATAPIEVAIVGQIERERAMELASVYLGSLPPRERIAKDTLADRRVMAAPGKDPVRVERAIPTRTPAAGVISGFFGPDAAELREVRLMNLASRVVTTRLIKQIREKDQLVYSIGASFAPGDTYPGYGLMLSGSGTDPARSAELAARIDEVFSAFAAEGPTEEEAETARKQIVKQLEEAVQQPAFWSGQLSQLEYRGRTLDEIVGAIEAYRGFTAEEIREAFARYHAERGHVTVIVKPQG